uniref:RAVE complex protein Rav1 C-terminal domain-containing protein n=1 Tax=Pavo cristatus TaxID=9049 RepID=A0A8C9FKM5_PAVCR
MKFLDDCLLKVWYPITGWKSSLLPQENEEKKKSSGVANFSFAYLAHPRAVTGFSWRNISKYMPRGLVCNVLLTSCLDGICRLWAETLLPEDTLLGEQICETSTSSISSTISQSGKHKDRIQHALEVQYLSILYFRIVRTCKHLLENLNYKTCQCENKARQKHHSFVEYNNQVKESETGTGTGSSEHEDGEREGSPKTSLRGSLRMPLPTVLLDRKIELLLTEWNRNPDMLFTIHPVDGTFLLWHVKYLDEYTPGIFRQVQVSFSSRIPVAFPSGDASSLSKNIMMYACPVLLKDTSNAVHQKTMDFSDKTLENRGPGFAQSSTNVNIISPIVMMISKHIDGSLNQWAVTFADKSAFTTVLTVSHKFRYCGHRFHLNDLACHSVLPLLLTSSHHNALLTPESDSSHSSDRINRVMDPSKHLKGPSRQQLKNAATRTFHDPNAIYSELILWRVDPIGPLSYTGGVSELARINSLHTSAFSNVAWLPTLIPSYCLGNCNAPGGVFDFLLLVAIMSVLISGHLSSSSIYPVCLAPYLIVTSCSDNRVRFWRCTVETDLNSKNEERETYHWRKWPLMNDEGEDNSSTVTIVGRPVAVSCSYTGRLAVAYKQPVQHNGYVSKEFSMHVCILECESTGGSEWVLEQTIHLDDLVKVGSVLDSRVSVDSNLFVYSKSDACLNKDKYLVPNIKHLVHLDWVSKEDGSHILTVGVGANIFMYGRLSGIVTDQTSSKEGVAVITLPLGGSIKQGIKSKWVLLRSIDLVSSVDGTPSLPVSLSWVRDGILVVGMDCEMHVYAQWKHTVKFGDGESDVFTSEDLATQDPLKTSLIAKKTSIIDGAGIVDDVFGTPTVIQDGGLFEAAHVLSPTLPQYHPTQLLELMDLGKVRRAKAILSHLVKCIAGEVAIVKDTEAGEGSGPKRHLSRTISVSGSTAKDTITAGKDGTRDYTEIDSIPPLPLYALLAADQDATYVSEETSKIPQGSEEDAKKKTEDQYSDLFQIQPVTTDDFIDFEPEKRESKSKVINLSQYGPTYFGREHASVLSSHLMHSSLPGLTRLEQMFLVALADTVATTSTELDENRDKNYSGRDTLDECGLRYLLAMRLHTCLLTSLPPLYRVQLLHQDSVLFHLNLFPHLLSQVCLEKMEDIQLAMVIARLYESEFETSVTYTSILYEKILGCRKDGTGFSCTKLHSDPFLRSIAYWIMKDYTRALDTLLEQTPKDDDENPVIVKACNPVVFSFYNYLRTHPLLIRRYFSSPEGTLATLGLKTEKSFVDKINLIERKLFFTTANAHFKVGCPVLALEVLSKIPKVRKKSALATEKDASSPPMQAGVSDSKALRDGAGSGDVDWSKPVSASFALEDTAESSAQFDWSQPAVKFDDEPLTLDWGEDKNESDEEDKDVGIIMKNSKSASKSEEQDKTPDANVPQTPHGEISDVGDTEVDVIAEQLKFRACLKILMTELRTLATGYEVDGGKLRFQLYNWLEKEIAAMHEICNHEAGGKDYCKTYTKVNGDLLDHENVMDKPDIGSYERHQIERRRLQAKREHAERRKWWLQKNQALLRVFLSYCSLHGAQGGGLASVRMELKFLLQESQQIIDFIKSSTKTVIANPVLYLNNHIHDILYTIVQMKSPPHPNIEDVKVMKTGYRKSTRCVITFCSYSSYKSYSSADFPSCTDFHVIQNKEKLNIVFISSLILFHFFFTKLIKRNLNNVKRMASHPVHQYYLTGAQDGSVRMFEWTRPQQLVCFQQAGNARVTRMYFNSQGNKSWQCHSKTTSDFAFITSSSLVATSGQSNDNRNVCLWDTLVSSANSLVHGKCCKCIFRARREICAGELVCVFVCIFVRARSDTCL